MDPIDRSVVCQIFLLLFYIDRRRAEDLPTLFTYGSTLNEFFFGCSSTIATSLRRGVA